MKSKILFLVFVIAAFIIHAQPQTAHWLGNEVVVGKSYVTYGDNVSVRFAPSIDADKIASLPINTPIEILEKSEEHYSVFGTAAPWVKIKSGSVEGYLVSGLLSLRSIALADGSHVLYTRAFNAETGYYQIKLRRAFKNSFVELGSHNLGTDDFNIELHDSKGLKNADHILKIDYLAEACGENGGRAYFVIHLDQEQMLYLGSYRSVGDGGMFHAGEDLIFPTDPDGMEGVIIYRGEEGAEHPDTMEYRTVSKVKHYQWADVEEGKKIKPFVYE